MQFHHHGYVSTDPKVQPAAGVGLNRPEELPDKVDVLIVGTGPAGMITAAQLSQFPDVNTRIIERRGGRLEIGQADGIQARSVETFQAFGFAPEIIAEAYHITEMNFWQPDPENPQNIKRTSRAVDDEMGISEFPHLIVNQARVLDYFAEVMENSPTRMKPDYGWEFVSLEIGEGEYPVTVKLAGTSQHEGQERTVKAKYVVGSDGARSKVRDAIGCEMSGDRANHAWGVMDVLANTDFPDIRTKCAIQSHDGGSILHIPREGGYLFRMYVDLGVVPDDDNGTIRATPLQEIIDRANKILHPYSVDVKSVAWNSVYEVGHRVTHRFDDVPTSQVGQRSPRVFITGDACHTHSAKAGQGMNVSMQDGFNIGWKLGHVLEGRSPESLLSTYTAERQVIAQNLIDFDRTWSSMMAKNPEDFESPSELADFYVRTAEFPAGFMTEYHPSAIVGQAKHQDLATGFPMGKRFKSAKALRISDTNPLHLGHLAQADGRWRIYAFADAAKAGTPDSAMAKFADWLANDPASPVVSTPEGLDRNAWFDVKAVYQQDHHTFDLNDVPSVFKPQVGEFQLNDLENVFGTYSAADIFEERGLSRDGVVVVVRPDQYVANIVPLAATDELGAFFAGVLKGHAAAQV
ncbi:FAD-binding monooxygenase [Sinomonas sp. ASV486]|uniref:FAD-binding monooxygenase n=1 Tax=Sinomonas sp. ASV486 TaxID=3051170 RepID=UPI0027DC4F9A|nr:FAD-binding monooxygenase [Sinomonas sp. ASV486]MDQ4489396.1 FAD-binding monooxygenase [Sinomonas sp. ASV486]